MSDAPTPADDRTGRTILGLRRSEWAIGATSVGLNALVNGVLPARWHLAASLGACGAIAGLAARAGAGPREQGIRARDVPKGVVFGVIAATPIVIAMGAGVISRRSREFYRDPRVTEASAREAAYHVFVRIPFGTALPEELIFRGAILGLLSRYHPPHTAAALSSILFGLWHIAPTVDRIESGRGIRRRRARGHREARGDVGRGDDGVRILPRGAAQPLRQHRRAVDGAQRGQRLGLRRRLACRAHLPAPRRAAGRYGTGDTSGGVSGDPFRNRKPLPHLGLTAAPLALADGAIPPARAPLLPLTLPARPHPPPRRAASSAGFA